MTTTLSIHNDAGCYGRAEYGEFVAVCCCGFKSKPSHNESIANRELADHLEANGYNVDELAPYLKVVAR